MQLRLDLMSSSLSTPHYRDYTVSWRPAAVRSGSDNLETTIYGVCLLEDRQSSPNLVGLENKRMGRQSAVNADKEMNLRN